MNQDRDNKRQDGRKNFNDRGNSNFKRNNFSFEKREMHKAVCSKCKKECEVPFKPTEGKPVFCKECYVKKKRF